MSAAAQSREAKKFDLSRRVTFVAVGQALAKVSQLVVGIILVRSLSDFDWNRIALVLLVYQTALGLGGLNFHQSLYFFLGRLPREEKRSFVLQNSALLAASGLVTALVVLIISGPVGGGYFQVDHLLPWVALALFIEIPTSGIPELLIAVERTGRAASVQAVLSLTQVTSVTVPILLTGELDAGVFGLLGYAILRLAFFVLLVRTITAPGPRRVLPHKGRWLPRREDIPWDRIKEQLLYVAPLAMALTVHLLNRNVDKWYVAWLVPEEFGLYTIAGTEVPIISVVATSLAAVLATRLVQGFRDGRLEYAFDIWMAGATRMTLLVVPVTVGVIAVAPELLVTMFGEGYAAAVVPFQIWTAILLHRVAEYGVVLRASGDTRALWWATSLLLVGNAVLSLLGILIGGIVGAAIGTALANMVAWAFLLRRIGRAMKRPALSVFPWRLWGTALTIAGACALLAHLITALIPLGTRPEPALAVKGALYVLAYLAVSRLFALRRRLPPVPDDGGELS